MTNFLSFSDHLDINEMLNVSFTEEEMDNLDKLTKEIILSENYEEAYALYEGENLQKIKDAFRRNPDESTFKKIVKYYAASWAGAYAGIGVGAIAGTVASGVSGKATKTIGGIPVSKAKHGAGIGNLIGTFLMILVLSVYRKSTDACQAKKNTPINWWRCQKDAAENTKIKLKQNEAVALSALNKGKDKEKEIAKLKEKVASKIEYLDTKIGKCDAKIKHLS
jgi:hypothetical protein